MQPQSKDAAPDMSGYQAAHWQDIRYIRYACVHNTVLAVSNTYHHFRNVYCLRLFVVHELVGLINDLSLQATAAATTEWEGVTQQQKLNSTTHASPNWLMRHSARGMQEKQGMLQMYV